MQNHANPCDSQSTVRTDRDDPSAYQQSPGVRQTTRPSPACTRPSPNQSSHLVGPREDARARARCDRDPATNRSVARRIARAARVTAPRRVPPVGEAAPDDGSDSSRRSRRRTRPPHTSARPRTGAVQRRSQLALPWWAGSGAFVRSSRTCAACACVACACVACACVACISRGSCMPA